MAPPPRADAGGGGGGRSRPAAGAAPAALRFEGQPRGGEGGRETGGRGTEARGRVGGGGNGGGGGDGVGGSGAPRMDAEGADLIAPLAPATQGEDLMGMRGGEVLLVWRPRLLRRLRLAGAVGEPVGAAAGWGAGGGGGGVAVAPGLG